MNSKKGQLTLGDAPSIVLIVGMVFLVMATIAFVSQKYGDAMPSENANSTTNETLTTVNQLGDAVVNYDACNFEDFTVSRCINSTGNETINTANYTTDANGYIYAVSGSNYNNTNWKCSYSYNYAGTGCDITEDLQTELGNNTSIAGIVLTISLVGIVLAALIGIFVIARNRGM